MRQDSILDSEPFSSWLWSLAHRNFRDVVRLARRGRLLDFFKLCKQGSLHSVKPNSHWSRWVFLKREIISIIFLVFSFKGLSVCFYSKWKIPAQLDDSKRKVPPFSELFRWSSLNFQCDGKDIVPGPGPGSLLLEGEVWVPIPKATCGRVWACSACGTMPSRALLKKP